jgi:hypothetical protein
MPLGGPPRQTSLMSVLKGNNRLLDLLSGFVRSG